MTPLSSSTPTISSNVTLDAEILNYRTPIKKKKTSSSSEVKSTTVKTTLIAESTFTSAATTSPKKRRSARVQGIKAPSIPSTPIRRVAAKTKLTATDEEDFKTPKKTKIEESSTPSTPTRIKEQLSGLSKQLTPQSLRKKGINFLKNNLTPTWCTDEWKKAMANAKNKRAIYLDIIKKANATCTNKKKQTPIKNLESLRLNHPEKFTPALQIKLAELKKNKAEAREQLAKMPLALEKINREIEKLQRLRTTTCCGRLSGRIGQVVTLCSANPLLGLTTSLLVTGAVLYFEEKLALGLDDANKKSIRMKTYTTIATTAANATFRAAKDALT